MAAYKEYISLTVIRAAAGTRVPLMGTWKYLYLYAGN